MNIFTLDVLEDSHWRVIYQKFGAEQNFEVPADRFAEFKSVITKEITSLPAEAMLAKIMDLWVRGGVMNESQLEEFVGKILATGRARKELPQEEKGGNTGSPEVACWEVLIVTTEYQ